MQVLVVLEEKVRKLLNLVQSLKERVSTLERENAELMKQLENSNSDVELRLKQDNEIIKELEQERDTTATVIDDLIGNIDSFIENEK